MKQIIQKAAKSILLILFLSQLVQLTFSQKLLTDDDLIKAVTTRPWKGQNFPLLPNLTTEIKGQVIGELRNQLIRGAYEKLDVNRQNVEWFEGIEELEKQKAVWSIQSCLIHPHDDVQIRALRSLERLDNKSAIPFILTYAEYMAYEEGGSENATIHGIIHETIAKTLSSLTGIKVEIKGQDPRRIKME